MGIQQKEVIAVDEREVARLTGRAVQSLRNDRHLGRGLPYTRIGRSIRYLVADVEGYLMRNRIDPEAV